MSFKTQVRGLKKKQERGLNTQRVGIKNKKGALKSMEYMLPRPEDTTKKGYIVRVLRFIPGKILYDVSPWTAEHFFQSGKFVAKMDMELQGGGDMF